MGTNRLAVIKDECGAPASLSENNLIDIYERGERGWAVVETVAINLGQTRGLEVMRLKIRELAGRLAGVRGLVGRSFNGVSFQILKQSRLSLCEMTGFEPGCLDELLAVLDAPEETRSVPLAPVETTEPGHYAFDLAAALTAAPELSSKKILRPFFNQTNFLELALTCDHLPPWLPGELERRGLTYATGTLPEGRPILVRIFPDCAKKSS
jgi:hypothetical protein